MKILLDLNPSALFAVWLQAGVAFSTKNTEMPFLFDVNGLQIIDKADESNKKIEIEFINTASTTVLTFVLTKASAGNWKYQFKVLIRVPGFLSSVYELFPRPSPNA